jgi:hypothetical protein
VFDDKTPPQGDAKPLEKPTEESGRGDTTPAVAAPETAPAAAAPASTAPATPGAPQPAGAAQPAANPPVEEKVVTVKQSSEPFSSAQIVASWKESLLALGLGDPEVAHLIAILEKQALRKDSATIVFRLDEEQLDSLLPIEITPTPDKQIRVALVVLLDADPDLMTRVEELVKQLGAPGYAEREAAEKRLRELGPAAKPKLQDAVNNSDPEISFRAEEIIESFDFPDAANAAAGR